MSLKLGINARTPLHLPAFDVTLFLLAFREDEAGRRVAAVSVQSGEDPPVEHVLRAGDELTVVSRNGRPVRLRTSFTRILGADVLFDEITA